MSLALSHLILAANLPVWLRATHWLNALFMGFMIRAGIQILGSYPHLWWNDNCEPGKDWLRFNRKPYPTDELWTSLDQETDVPMLIGQPGGNNLGLGRIWHFATAVFWIANGLVYVVLLCTSGLWINIVPTNWNIIPRAWETAVDYMTFHIPPASMFTPYDPLQLLSYFGVVFILAPFMILTAAAQSPAIEARFPRYSKLWGGRQSARSLHFLGLVAFVGFILIHTALVWLTGPAHNFGEIIYGAPDVNPAASVAWVIGLTVAIFLVYWLTSAFSQARPRVVQNVLGVNFVRPIIRTFLDPLHSRQQYRQKDISPYFTINGSLPSDPDYVRELWTDFADWRLEIGGLVEAECSFSLADLRAMPKQQQITKHNCIQGWTGVAEWGGVCLSEVLDRCKPLANAKYVTFISYSEDNSSRPYYETLPIALARHPQTILAYEMNYEPLPVPHGAPLRLRCETQLGYKMVKWIHRIEFVESFHDVREGQGGSREDNRYYEPAAAI